jgi:transcriptional regulator with XRE-family HTH domain
MTKDEFGTHLYRLMVAKGWRQSDLARAAGLPRNNISTYIRGRSYPARETLHKLAEALAIPIDELLPEHDILPVRGQLPAELELRVSADRPDLAFLAIRRWVPLAIASRVIALVSGGQS